eukprot:PhM_4_TR18066/c0_g1_i1/m.101830
MYKLWCRVVAATEAQEREEQAKIIEQRRQVMMLEAECRVKVRVEREERRREILKELDASFKAVRRIEHGREMIEKQKQLAIERAELEKQLKEQRFINQRETMSHDERQRRSAIENEWTFQFDAIGRSRHASVEEATRKYNARRHREAREAEIARVDAKLPRVFWKLCVDAAGQHVTPPRRLSNAPGTIARAVSPATSANHHSHHQFTYHVDWQSQPQHVFGSYVFIIELDASRELTEEMATRKMELLGGELHVEAINKKGGELHQGDTLSCECRERSAPPTPLQNEETKQYFSQSRLDDGKGLQPAPPPGSRLSIAQVSRTRRFSRSVSSRSTEERYSIRPTSAMVRAPTKKSVTRFDDDIFMDDQLIARVKRPMESHLVFELVECVDPDDVCQLLHTVAYSNTHFDGFNDFDLSEVNPKVYINVRAELLFRKSAFTDEVSAKSVVAETHMTGTLEPPLWICRGQKFGPSVEYLEGDPPVQLFQDFILCLENCQRTSRDDVPPPGTIENIPSVVGFELCVELRSGWTSADHIRLVGNSVLSFEASSVSQGVYDVKFGYQTVATIAGYDEHVEACNSPIYITFVSGRHCTLLALQLVLSAIHFECTSDEPEDEKRTVVVTVTPNDRTRPSVGLVHVSVVPVEDPLVFELLPPKDTVYRTPTCVREELEEYMPLELLHLAPHAVVSDVDIGLFKEAILEVQLVNGEPGDCLVVNYNPSFVNCIPFCFHENEEHEKIIVIDSENGEKLGTVVEGICITAQTSTASTFKDKTSTLLRIHFSCGTCPLFWDVAGLQSIIRSVAFCTTSSTFGSRRAVFSLLLGDPVDDTSKRRYDPRQPVESEVSFEVLESLISLPSGSEPELSYREGSGAVPLAAFNLLDEFNPNYRQNDGGFLRVRVVDGQEDGADELLVRTVEEQFSFPASMASQSKLSSMLRKHHSTLTSVESFRSQASTRSATRTRRSYNQILINVKAIKERADAVYDKSTENACLDFCDDVFEIHSNQDGTCAGLMFRGPDGFMLSFYRRSQLPRPTSSSTPRAPAKPSGGAKKRLAKSFFNLSSTVTSGGQQPTYDLPLSMIRRKELLHLVRHITYRSLTEDPQILRKVLLISVNDGHYSTSHIPFVVVINPVDDATEIICDRTAPLEYRQGSAADGAGYRIFHACSLFDPDTVEFYGGFLSVSLDAGGFGGYDLFGFLSKEQQVDVHRCAEEGSYYLEEQLDSLLSGLTESTIYKISLHHESSSNQVIKELVGRVSVDASDKCCPKWTLQLANKEEESSVNNNNVQVAHIDINLVQYAMKCITYRNVAPSGKLKASPRVFALRVNASPATAPDGRFKITMNVLPPLWTIPEKSCYLKYTERSGPMPLFSRLMTTLPDSTALKSGFLSVELHGVSDDDRLVNSELLNGGMSSTKKPSFTIQPNGMITSGREISFGPVTVNTCHKFHVCFDASSRVMMRVVMVLIKAFHFQNDSSVPITTAKHAVISFTDTDEDSQCVVKMMIETVPVDDMTELHLNNEKPPVYVRNGDPVHLCPGATVSDADNDIFPSGSTLDVFGSRADIITLANYQCETDERNTIWCDDTAVYRGSDKIGHFVTSNGGPTPVNIGIENDSSNTESEESSPETKRRSLRSAVNAVKFISASSKNKHQQKDVGVEDVTTETNGNMDKEGTNLGAVMGVSRARRVFNASLSRGRNLSLVFSEVSLESLQLVLRSILFANDDSVLEKVPKKEVRIAFRGGTKVSASRAQVPVRILPPLFELNSKKDLVFSVVRQRLDVFPYVKLNVLPTRISLTLRRTDKTSPDLTHFPFLFSFNASADRQTDLSLETVRVKGKDVAELTHVSHERLLLDFSSFQEGNIQYAQTVLRSVILVPRAIKNGDIELDTTKPQQECEVFVEVHVDDVISAATVPVLFK